MTYFTHWLEMDVAGDIPERMKTGVAWTSDMDQIHKAVTMSLKNDGFPQINLIVMETSGPAGGNPVVRFFGSRKDLTAMAKMNEPDFDDHRIHEF